MLPLLALFLSACAGGGGSATARTSVAVHVAVSPRAATVPTGGSAQFVATMGNQTPALIQWEVNHVPGGSGATGTINSAGLYQAPATVPAAPVEITAVLQTDTRQFGSAAVTVVAPVSVSPRQASLTTSQSVQFQAAGPAAGAGVSWSATGGTITSSGLFTPAVAGIFTVTATSATNPPAVATATVYVTDLAGQFSWRNDAGLTGQNRQEPALHPANVSGGSFGKVSSCPVDGQVHAQPLYAANLSAGGRVRNVVYVATEHDSVYAFDADAVPCRQVWMRTFLDQGAGTTSVPGEDIPGNDISPEVGISGTPVIDRAGGTLYLVAKTKERVAAGYVQRLHALDLATGAAKLGGPVVIAATAPGNGDGNDATGRVPFDPLLESQRAALLLAGGNLYIAFGGRGPTGAYHGWLLVYDAASLRQVGAFNTTPDGTHGSFAESGAGASADAAGYIFAATGHGAFDATVDPRFRKNFAQTVLKLQPAPSLTIADTFTPSSQSALTMGRNDVGSSGVLVLPDQIGAANPRLAIVGASSGTLYVLNRDNLGGYSAPAPDRAIKTLTLPHGIHGTPAYWQGFVYVAAAGDPVKAYPLSAGTLADAPSSQSGSAIGAPGASPVVSSSGGSGGVVWVVDTGGADSGAPAVLRAFDAADLARELYDSSSKPEDAAGPAAKLAAPTVANGKVYVGTRNEVTVYGLLP